MSLDLGLFCATIYHLWAVFTSRPPRQTVHRAVAVAATLAVVLSSLLASPAQAEQGPKSLAVGDVRSLAPTFPGAPFLPNSSRTELVLERLAVLEKLDALHEAQAALATRSDGRRVGSVGYEETQRILSSQIAAIERVRMSLDAKVAVLTTETVAFGLEGAAIFPVASLRKPFFDDWGRPRSGGRRHQGTDLLAQIGVELRAIEDGTVERITNGSLGGLSIYLLGDSGSRYYYAHLEDVFDFEQGERVYAGEAVGTIGDSGNARGAPHLHMQWDRRGGSNWENPFPLLDVLFGEGASARALAENGDLPEMPLFLVNADG